MCSLLGNKNLYKFAILVLISIVRTNAETIPRDGRMKSRAATMFGRNWGLNQNGRFLSLFTVVQWGQGLCQAVSGEYGSCITSSDCAIKGGTSGGPCAEGYGICCIFMQSCGGIVRDNGTYFVNPNHPDAFDQTGSCQLTVLKSNPDVCQLRLDFDHFAIASPEPTNHICNTDQFLVSGGSPAPTVCGTSHGDHMYIDAGLGQSNPIILTVITSGASYPRTWRIRITQIPCSSIWKADQGCLQYFTGVNGRVRSFNFDTSNGRQLSNQDYSICIRNERNFCNIQYTACVDSAHNRSQSFTLSGNSNSIVNSMVGGGSQGTPNSCTADWLLIGCARVSDRLPVSNTCEDRVCGGTFNAEVSSVERTVTSNIRPFRLAFHADAVEAPIDVDNRGFCLDFVQQPCTSG